MKIKILSLALAALLLAASMTACSDPNGSAETETAAGTTAETETALPRFDYNEADVAADVTIDRADYAGLTLKVSNSLKLQESDVTAYIEQLRFQKRTAVNGTTMVKDKPLALGDDAYIYYKGFLDGVAFEGGSNWDDESPYKLGLGSGSFIPGFEASLVGVVPNATSKTTPAEINVSFPEDYHQADLAGKAVVFRVCVEYAVQYTMPAYDRAFVETTMKYEPKKETYESDEALLEEFEAYVFDYLTEQNQSNLDNAIDTALWNRLSASATCRNLPQDEVNYYYSTYVSELDYYYEYYKAYGGEQFTTQYPTKDAFAVAYYGLAAGASWQSEVTAMAETMVKRDMIMHAIAELEGFEKVTDDEYNAQVTYWLNYYSAQYGNVSRDDVIKNLGEANLREAALSAKVADWLREQNTFTYEDGTPIVTTTDNEA